MSNAVHHVELCKDPVLLSPSEDKHVFLDECNKEVVSINSHKISYIPLEGEKKGIRFHYKIVRQTILNAKFSPDHTHVAVQFSPMDIEFTDLEHNITFVHSFKGKKGKGTILNFFWTFPDNLVVVLSGSVELYQFPKQSKSKDGLKLLGDIKMSIGWCHYSSDSRHRMLLTSPPLAIQAIPSLPPSVIASLTIPINTFYFRNNKIIKIPKFDIDSDGIPLARQELVIHQLYDAIYCIHINNRRKELVLYQLTKEAVIRRTRLELLGAGTSHIHIVDNLLLIHSSTSRVTMMFDIKIRKDMERFPVASPLPISAIPYEPPAQIDYSLDSHMMVPVFPHSTSINPVLYSNSWNYFMPNYILDKSTGHCWTVGLNLDGVVQSLTNDRCRMTEFLLRRTHARTKQVLLKEAFNMIVEHESLAVVAQVFDAVNAVLASQLQERGHASAHSPLRRSASTSTIGKDKSHSEHFWGPEQPESTEASYPDEVSPSCVVSTVPRPTTPPAAPRSYTQPQPHHHSASVLGGADVSFAITQGDMYAQVFVPLEARDPPLLHTKYVVGVITEYMRSLNFHHIAVTPFLYELLINFLVCNGRWHQLHQLLQYHVVSDSTHVACQLLSLESKYPPAYQLALDMMKRLSSHEQILEVLISKNLIMHALRFMKNHRVKIPPKRILEAAVQLQDNTVFFHAFKFFEGRKELNEECEKYKVLAKNTFGVNVI